MGIIKDRKEWFSIISFVTVPIIKIGLDEVSILDVALFMFDEFAIEVVNERVNNMINDKNTIFFFINQYPSKLYYIINNIFN